MANIRYLVDDVDKAIKFYCQRLGFEEIERWGPAFAIVKRDDIRLWLSGPKTSAAKEMPDGRKPAPGGWNRIVITVDDLPAAVERLKKEGVVFRNEMISGPGGCQILAEDTSGNPIELFESA
jgi:catechol 2,3-dioxygenase-like lactoylglutathione lyase family enzyme